MVAFGITNRLGWSLARWMLLDRQVASSCSRRNPQSKSLRSFLETPDGAMRHRPHLPIFFVAAWLASAAVTIRPGLAGEEAPAPTPEQVRFFETQVRPTLAEHCFKCHGPDKQKANLRLDS